MSTGAIENALIGLVLIAFGKAIAAYGPDLASLDPPEGSCGFVGRLYRVRSGIGWACVTIGYAASTAVGVAMIVSAVTGYY